jgi:phosphotransferase system  glucose/maltose/N-acetylglucosamine-specific IIC component
MGTKSETVIEKRKWFSRDSKAFDFLQKLGKVLMVVIAVMPAAGIMISIGKLIGMTDFSWLDSVGAVVENIGWAIITNLNILFADEFQFKMNDQNVCISVISAM